MTDTFNAGEIEITVKLDASNLKGEFAALQISSAKSAADLGKGLAEKIGEHLVVGFKAGQFGKQINKTLEEQLKTGSPKLLAAFKEFGTQGGKELVTAYLKESGKINAGLKAKTGKIGGILKAGLKGLAKGGAVGLALEGINFLAGKAIKVIGKGLSAGYKKLRPNLHAAKEAASVVA